MKDDILQIRVSSETRETLKFMAGQLGLTVSAYIRMILIEKIKNEGAGKKSS